MFENETPPMRDPTAQTEPLSEGQKIVAQYEKDVIAEPCELAAAIDLALIRSFRNGYVRCIADVRKATNKPIHMINPE